MFLEETNVISRLISQAILGCSTYLVIVNLTVDQRSFSHSIITNLWTFEIVVIISHPDFWVSRGWLVTWLTVELATGCPYLVNHRTVFYLIQTVKNSWFRVYKLWERQTFSIAGVPMLLAAYNWTTLFAISPLLCENYYLDISFCKWIKSKRIIHELSILAALNIYSFHD